MKRLSLCCACCVDGNEGKVGMVVVLTLCSSYWVDEEAAVLV